MSRSDSRQMAIWIGFALLGSLPACGSRAPAHTTPPDVGARTSATPSDADARTSDAPTPDDGPPSLTALTVSLLQLHPAFSPSIHDYYVRCFPGQNPLSVSMTPSYGATAALTRPAVIPAAPGQQVTVDVTANQAIVATATRGGATTAYWIRCLPYDFPPLLAIPHPEAGTPPPGYYLVGDTFHALHDSGYAMILDGQGTPVWYGATKNGAGAINVELLDKNTISYIAFDTYAFGASYTEYEVHTLNPLGVGYVSAVNAPLDTHELRRLPNGDYLLLATPVVMGVDLTGIAHHGPNGNVVDCVIQEVAPDGSLVWQWNAMDHFDPQDCTYPEDGKGTIPSVTGTFAVLDAFHCNSIDLDPNGDLLVSSRHMDSIFLVSRSSGKVLWKMGGAPHVKDGEPFIQVVGDPMNGFHRQHHARFQPDGTITLFDDETKLPGPARGIVISYDVAAGTASIAWQYKGRSSSGAMGSVSILPDGSRVIGWGSGGANPTFTEVNENGEALLDFAFSDGDTSYRALKVPASAVNLDVLREAAGGGSG